MQEPPTTRPEKMYVLVRADLPAGAQLAQAIHASVELALAEPEHVKATPTVVVLNVENEDALLEWADRHSGEIPAPWQLFHEPDLEGHPDGWHTALATISDGAVFADLPLAGAAMV